MKTSVCIFLFFIGVVFARTPQQSNHYVDLVLRSNLPREARNWNVDPARLNNFTTQHKDKLGGIKVNVNVEYYNVNMTGLLKVRREKDCSGLRRDFGNVTLNCTLVFNGVKIHYNVKAKYGKLPKANGKVTAELSGDTAFAVFTTSINRNYPVMKAFYFTRRGSPKVRVSGFGPLNDTGKKLIHNDIYVHAQNEFLNVVNYNFVPALKRAASQSPMPAM
ncbi:uncharacterized protein LOC111642349 [Centruroides sculpturatus]|uniref:uncharacterized protein LOC111642349 n=1 Tax=Centruroides sculpturatus TaxID=218467 RepID=UPI000C6DFED4|nr:uncharacterized protein LOC111642349 [Centruroides sculpturatus]